MIESRFYFSSPSQKLTQDVIAHVAKLIGSVDCAAFLISPECIENNDPESLKSLVETVQAQGIAVIIADDIASMNILLADGVQISTQVKHFESCRAALGDRFIIGAYVATSKHNAMIFGEKNADYIAFGADDDNNDSDVDAETSSNQDIVDLAIWWKEMFNIPAIAYVKTAEAIEDIKFTTLHPDFIAFLPEFWDNDKAEQWLEQLCQKSVES